MARPTKRRRICELPNTDKFRPQTNEEAEVIVMSLDEYESVRLIDYLGLSQEDCALQMNVARTTVQAIYDSARKKIADMLVHGKSLDICGGSYEICNYSRTCCGKNCSNFRTGNGTCSNSNSDSCHCCKADALK